MNENVKHYLEAVGFKVRPEHKEISQDQFDELLKKPEFRSMIDTFRKGQININVVPQRNQTKQSEDEYVVLDEQGETEPEVMAIPETKPISGIPGLPSIPEPKLEPKPNVPLTNIPARVGGVGGSPQIVKGSKQRKGKTTIQIDDDIAEIMKLKKGNKSFNAFLRELLE